MTCASWYMFHNLTLLNDPTANLPLESDLRVFSQKIQQKLKEAKKEAKRNL